MKPFIRSTERPPASDEPAAKLGQHLYAMRVHCGMQQGQLAQRIGISQTQLSRIERGNSAPSWAVLMAIAAAFEITPSQLLSTAGL